MWRGKWAINNSKKTSNKKLEGSRPLNYLALCHSFGKKTALVHIETKELSPLIPDIVRSRGNRLIEVAQFGVRIEKKPMVSQNPPIIVATNGQKYTPSKHISGEKSIIYHVTWIRERGMPKTFPTIQDLYKALLIFRVNMHLNTCIKQLFSGTFCLRNRCTRELLLTSLRYICWFPGLLLAPKKYFSPWNLIVHGNGNGTENTGWYQWHRSIPLLV